MAFQTKIATASSVLIRIGSYFFLRWALIPFVPPIVFALFAVNVPSILLSYFRDDPNEVVEEIDVVVTDTIAEDVNGNRGVAKEKVDITDTVAVRPKPLRPLRTLLLGAPSRSKLLSLLALVVNSIIVALVADRLYTEHAITGEDLSFVRLGYVSDSEARFLIREPDQAKMPVTMEIRLKHPEPPFDTPLWLTAGGVRWTENITDFTAVLTVPLRHPIQHVYEWRTSNNHSGEVMAAPKPGAAPRENGGNFTFIATSCMVSRLPYSPFDHPLAIPGARHLANVLPGLGAQFLLFLGDFVYVDVPRWWGKTVSDYRQKYRQVYASPDWPAISQNLSWIHVLDDHEISNDWSSNQTGVYHTAVEPYQHYHAAANPPLARQAADTPGGGLLRSPRPGATYFQFSQGPASFFMLDTRSFRSSNSLPFDDANKTMLGAGQLADVLDYLRRPEPQGVKWKILASSVPFTKNWRVNRRDTWGGFLAERRVLLEAMWDAGLRGTGVVILSGDRHEFAATRFPPPPENATRWPASVAVHEFSASPLNQFYSPIPSYFQWDDEDVKMQYIYRGNSKFGTVTILPPDAAEVAAGVDGTEPSRLHYRLFINGKEAWDTTIESPRTAASSKAKKPKSFWSRILGQ